MTVETRRKPGLAWLQAEKSGVSINITDLHAARETVVQAAAHHPNGSSHQPEVTRALRTIAVFNDLNPRHQDGITLEKLLYGWIAKGI